MTTGPDYDETEERTEDQPAEQEARWRRDLERRAAEGDKAREEARAALERAQRAEREAAMLRLGIDPESKQGRLLAKVHEGDWTADAVRATASEYDLVPPSTATPEQVAAQQQVQQVTEGAEHTSPVSDLEAEFAKLPKFGEPGWERGKQMLLDLNKRAGVDVHRSRPRGGQPKLINPVTNRPIQNVVDLRFPVE